MAAMHHHQARSSLLLLLVLITGFVLPQKPNMDNYRRHDVYVAGFFPYGKGVENSETGRGVMPSVKLALDHVNEHTQVLRNHRLHMWWNDTMCNAAVGVKAFFDMMHSGPNKLMLFGAACTHVTDPIAKASKHWHLTQLSYADTHPMFTKENFPNFFRIVPSENAFNAPRLALLKQFNWTRVGTIYQNEPRYSLAHNRLVAELDSLSYQVVETQSFVNDVSVALAKLKEKDTRIILGNFNERWARMLFCEAYKLGMYGRKYQWILMATYSHQWWRNAISNDTSTNAMQVNCTIQQLEAALQQTILTDLLPLSTSGEITISGIAADEYKVEYDSRRGTEYSRFHGYTYDGVWAVALAIQNVATKIKYFRRNQTVDDFRYHDPLWERLFLDALYNTSFEGVTGPVRFYNNERRAGILLKQFQDGAEIKVGEYSAATQHLDLTLGTPLRWIGKMPPKDRTLVIIEHTRVNKTVYAILASLAVCGIFMASVFLAFNIRYRNQRYIKMSSPQLNNLIIIGCMLTYTSIIFLGLDSGLSSQDAFPYICTTRVWTLMAGFTLAFGAMFSKTWRVHSIFTDVKLNKKIIKDYKLFMVVGVLLFLDVVIMVTWQVTDPFFRDTKRLGQYPHPSSDEDIIIIPENEYCASEHMTIFMGVIYAYKGLLMIFGAFLAWETRTVSIPALNDSRHVGLSVYNVAILCICGAAVALVLQDHQDALFLIIGVFILFCTTATLCLVFVPKMLELRRNPSGAIDKKGRATLRPMSKSGGGGMGGAGAGHRDSTVSELECKMKDVRSLNTKYRKTLMEMDSELQMLMRRLSEDESNGIAPSAISPHLTVPQISVKRETPTVVTESTEITSSTYSAISSQDLCVIASSAPTLQAQSNDVTMTQSVTYSGAPMVMDSHYSMSVHGPMAHTHAPTPPRRQSVVHQTALSGGGAVSIPAAVLTPTTTQHIVAKSELWDTPSMQHRCTKSHAKLGRTNTMTGNAFATDECTGTVSAYSLANDEPVSYSMSRTVSERQKSTSAAAAAATSKKSPQLTAKRDSVSNICAQQCTKLGGYCQSTPNMATANRPQRTPEDAGPHRQRSPKLNGSSIGGSESELLDDCEILPIFQKLLTERNKSQSNIDYASFGRSCPNISIKCDIVEYL